MQAYNRRTVLAALGSCGLLAVTPRPAAQTAWPSKPITLIVPFAAGVSPDVVARLLADRMGQALGQPIIVDNRAGASGIIGAELAAKAPADGYALFLAVESILGVLPHIYAKLRYDPFRDFVPVTQVAYGPFYLVTAPDQPFTTLAAMLERAKAQPDFLTYGSLGVGSGAHMRMVMLSSMTGVSLLHVPYKSSPLPDVMSRNIAMAFEPATTAIPLVRSGKLRALAVTSATRQAALPDVPAVAEIVPNFDNDGWMALVAPAGTPPAVIDRLNAEAVKALKAPEVRSRIADLGLQAVGSTAGQCSALIKSEFDKWGKIARQYQIRAD
ncbi:tripartite tricarboxylate transporter substrate binding protein [Variovorax sp. LjRoot290]|uniref:Bug family tripartite tricarboxylate transporter substrate binding protein n=1 Tax=Variovorax sp. LjRoot290 TaxID=3342316 RepID=UPI003ECD6A70